MRHVHLPPFTLITRKESTEVLQRLAEQRLLGGTVRSGTRLSGTQLSGTWLRGTWLRGTRLSGTAEYSNKAVSATPHAHRPFRSAPHLSLPSRDVPVDRLGMAPARFEAANSTRGTWQSQLWLAAWPSCTTTPSLRTWRPSTSFANPLSEKPALPQKSTGEINACSLSFLPVRELLVASGGDTRFQCTHERAALFRAASSSDARCLAKPQRRSLRSSSEPCARTWTLSPVRSTCPILG
jgi:hypothetical protein